MDSARRRRVRIRAAMFLVLTSFMIVSYLYSIDSIPEVASMPEAPSLMPPQIRLPKSVATSPPPEKEAMYRDSYSETSAQFIQETQALMRQILTRNSSASKQFSWSRLSTKTKRNSSSELNYLRYTPDSPLDNNTTRRLRVMVVGGMHAREMFTSDFCRSWILYSALASVNPDQRTSVAPIDWVFVPVSNPSGRDLVAASYRNDTDSFQWSKCHRGNGNGVDLNRNWRSYDEDIYQGLDRRVLKPRPTHRLENRPPLPEENPGTESFSEPETNNLRDLLHSFKPDILLTIHT